MGARIRGGVCRRLRARGETEILAQVKVTVCRALERPAPSPFIYECSLHRLVRAYAVRLLAASPRIGLPFRERSPKIFLRRLAAFPSAQPGSKPIRIMKKRDPQPPEKKKSDVEVRDLEPKKDPKAGSSKSQVDGKNRPRRIGEIDIMWDVD